MVLPARGLNDLSMGGYPTEQPLFGKVFVRPAHVRFPPTDASDAVTFAKDAPQTHPNPTVERREGGAETFCHDLAFSWKGERLRSQPA